MNGSNDLQRLVADWLAADAPTSSPDGLHADVVAAARRSRQHPRWLARIRIRSVRRMDSLRVAGRGALALAVVALVLLALLAIALAIGGQRRLPPPFGPAGNGLMAFGSAGRIYAADESGVVGIHVPGGDVERTAPSWSPDGRRLAFWSSPAANDIRLAVLDDSSDTIEIPLGPIEPDTSIAAEWSPDSRRLVFAEAAPDAGRIHVADLVTQTLTELPIHGVQASHPTWSPDGRWLAFPGMPEHSLDVGVYIVHPDGTGLRRLPTSDIPTAVDDYGSVRWSPDPTASLLAYTFNANAVGDIAVFDVAAGREAIVSEEVANEFWPTWSPDGRHVAWLSLGDPAEVRVADIGPGPTVSGIRSVLISPPSAPEDGSTCGESPSLAGDFVCQPPQWSPDGRSIYAADVLGTQIMVVSADGSTPTRRIVVPETGPVSWQRVAP
jgi:hypothetical protein